MGCLNLRYAALIYRIGLNWLCLISFLSQHTQAFRRVHTLDTLNTDVEQRYRTGFHFQPQKNWMNDPNGPMFYKGYYHLFYQYNPEGPIWGNIVWGHSVSQDLIHWRSLDAAIVPSEWYDIEGCWSGSATFVQGGNPVILYTGDTNASQQVQNMAVPKNLSDPLLREWNKIIENPVLVPDGGIDGKNFRDPTTGWFGSGDKKWRIVVGSQEGVSRGMALLYKSADFIKWEKAKQPLHSSEYTGMWECPDFYPVPLSGKHGLDTSSVGSSVKHVMKASFHDHDYYAVGRYLVEEDVFVPDKGVDFGNGLRYDYGKFYASKSFFDGSTKRRVLWGWVSESDRQSDDLIKGWASLQGIPRAVWLDSSTGRQLIQWPVVEVESLRGKKTSRNNIALKNGEVVEIDGVTGAQVDVEVSFDLPTLKITEFEEMDGNASSQQLCSNIGVSHKGVVGPFGLLVLASKDITEHTAVFYQIIRHQKQLKLLMCSDQSRSSTHNYLDKTTYGTFVPLTHSEKTVSLRVLVDNSILESFGGGGKSCITARVYPTLAIGADAHLFVFNNGSNSILANSLNAWNMKTINNIS